jgi:ADP-ribose pyrophosphatase YjhB (NUDIX family)
MDENKDLHQSQVTQDVLWRPIQSIRPKVIGIAKKEDRLLVCEVLSDQGELKGWCPLGGGIEFGETAEQALNREISEELGCSIHILNGPMICENIFEHHGVQGHEVIFAFSIIFDDSKIYMKQRFQIYESHGSMHWVEWVEMERFRSGKETLFPLNLIDKIL